MAMEAFQKLLESRRSRKSLENEDRASRERLLRDGLSLITSALYKVEAHHNIKTSREQGVESLIVSLRNYVTYAADPSRKDIPYCSAKLAALTLEKIVQPDTSEEINTDIEMRNVSHETELLDNFVQILQQLKAVGRLKETAFMTAAVDLKLPVQVLSRLQKTGLLPLSAYILQNCGKSDVIEEFTDDVLKHLEQTDHKMEGAGGDTFEDCFLLLGSLLRQALGEEIVIPEPESMQRSRKASLRVLNMLINQTTERVLADSDNSPSGTHFLPLRERERELGADLVSSFLSLSLEALTSGPTLPLEKALNHQQYWLLVEPPRALSTFLGNLLSAVGLEQALSSISSMLDNVEANWQRILTIITAFLRSHEGAVDRFKGYIDGIFSRAMALQDRHQLGLALLLARHASIGSAGSAFPSYSAWWGIAVGTTSGTNSPVASPVAFTFLISFLTQLVPNEPPVCLRVQLNRTPSAPAGCNQLLADYVALAKTRLHDLGECTASGLFSLEATPTQDVQVALEQFERSGGQVSRVLLDTARFRKVHFEQFFLPALLVPEVQGPNMQPSVRQQLIAKLRAVNKIPAEALAQYDEACKCLRTFVAQEDPSSDEGMSNEPMEQWQRVLDSLVDTVRSTSRDDAMEVEEAPHASSVWGTATVLPPAAEAALANVCCHVRTALHWAQEQSNATFLKVQMVKRILKAYMQSFKPPAPSVVSQSLVWPMRFLSMVEPHPSLDTPLHTVLFKMGINTTLKPYMIEAIASLSCGCDERDVLRKASAADVPSIGQAVGKTLKPVNQQSMLHALRFSSTYLQLLNASLGSSPPCPLRAPSLLQLLLYLRGRLLHSSRMEVLSACDKTWIPPASWRQLVAQSSLSLEEWLKLEAEVTREEDPVQPSHLYRCTWLRQHAMEDIPVLILLAASLQASRSGAKEWSQELLALLPSLIPAIHSSVEPQDVPGLLSAWEFMSKQFYHSEIYDAVQALPPWMLLTDFLGCPPSTSAVSALAHFMMKHLKDSLTRRGFLTQGVICMLIGAVSSSFPLNPGEALSKLIDECPAVHIALLVHFDLLQSSLVPTFTQKTSRDSSLLRIVNVTTSVSPAAVEIAADNLLWQRGLVLWARNLPRDYSVEGFLFFDLLEKGNCLLEGVISLVKEGDRVWLPEGISLGKSLLEEPLHCMQMILKTVDPKSNELPASGISTRSLMGLCLVSVAAVVSLPANLLPVSGSETASMCIHLLKGCLRKWLKAAVELDQCPAKLRDIACLRDLIKCTNDHLMLMGCSEGISTEQLASCRIVSL